MRLRRGMRVPLRFLVDHDGVRRMAQQADRLGMLGRTEEDDRVALIDELLELALLGQHPRAGAVDDLQPALFRAGHDRRRHAVGADHDRRSGVDLVEAVDRADALRHELLDDALVVDDLAEGMRLLALCGGHLGVIDGFPDAIAEARAARDDDLIDGSHVQASIARGARGTVERPLATDDTARSGRSPQRTVAEGRSAWPTRAHDGVPPRRVEHHWRSMIVNEMSSPGWRCATIAKVRAGDHGRHADSHRSSAHRRGGRPASPTAGAG